jgi:hypothetical protein
MSLQLLADVMRAGVSSAEGPSRSSINALPRFIGKPFYARI